MIDKEVPYEQIPMEDRDLYKEAENKEWSSWLEYNSVEIMSVEDSHKIRERKAKESFKV